MPYPSSVLQQKKKRRQQHALHSRPLRLVLNSRKHNYCALKLESKETELTRPLFLEGLEVLVDDRDRK